ncbi:hypothetical protein pdam_00000464, partial [Pocillopora damicornis]
SLLGTIQFLLFVDDLSNAVKTSGVACYADDTCDTEKDLGVWVSSNLTSDKQVSEQCAKAKNSSGLCADFLGTSKAPKRVVHCTSLSSGAISAMQPKYGRHIFFYKAVNNLVFIDSEALPVSRQFTRSTRSSSSSAITYIPKRSRTVTYRRSFFIRLCRTHGTLRTNHIFLASFKSLLLQYYKKALKLYNVDDIRTWRTICP